MFGESQDYDVIPEALKQTYISSLHRGGSEAIPENYWPMALTVHISVFKSNDVNDTIGSNNLHNPGQHGFKVGTIFYFSLDYHDKIVEAGENEMVM